MNNFKFRVLIIFASIIPILLTAGNPLEVRKIVLNNGLTVYLNEDHSKSEIFGAVIVKAGSRHDPEDATGIAHYFEHIMFKGTDRIGTVDWESEKVYLDSISVLYDDLANILDEQARKQIQQGINRLSVKAAEYAIPNEVDILLRDIGGTGINAWTSFEQTVYYNSFPAYQLEKWMEIYAERFRNPVFRLFQSELETVYEEKNLYSDIPIQLMIEDFLKTMYKEHPYSKPIIGLTEHLKNPSLSKMAEFFNTWYVANNMAIVLIGSFETESVIPMIEEKFGNWRRGDLPGTPDYSLAPFSGREFRQVRMSPVRIGLMGFRSVPSNHPDNAAFEVTTRLLNNNAGTGIFDKLMMDNKLMAVEPFALQAPDHGSYLIFFMPKVIGQSLSSAEALVNEGLNILLSGGFTNELLEAVKLEYRIEFQRRLENPESRAYMLIEAFTEGREWEDLLNELAEIENITRNDIIRIASQYLGDDKLVYWSKMGFPKKDKLEKPEWDPVIPQNSEKRSEFGVRLDTLPEFWTEPKFIRFGEDVKFEPVKDGYVLYHTPNPYNEIFTLSLKYHRGILHDVMVESAADYLNLIGTKEKPFQQYRSELQQIGATVYIDTDDNFLTIEIEGIDENLTSTLKLLNELLRSPGKDDTQLEKFRQEVKGRNKFRRDDPMSVGNALYRYALYGEMSPDMRNLTFKQAKKLNGDHLIETFKGVLKYEADIIYCGSLAPDEVQKVLSETIIFPDAPLKGNYIELPRNQVSQHTVYLNHNNKARQSNINFHREGNILSEQELALVSAFNEYFGGSMSSLVFQEIREFRSLSYAAYAVLRTPFLRSNPSYLMGYMNTQSDKTIEGIEAMRELILTMPEKPDRMESIRKGLLQSVYTSEPEFRNKGNTVARWRLQGYESDPRQFRYSIYNRIDFNDIVKFYKDQLGGNPLMITVTGNLKPVDKKDMEAFGVLIELKYKDFIRE